MKAYSYINNKHYVTEIDEVKTNLSEDELEKLRKSFNKKCLVMEWGWGCSYYFHGKGKIHRSSSLEEIFEQYKAFKTNQPVPEAKCTFNKLRINE